jgi:hypothetical protein
VSREEYYPSGGWYRGSWTAGSATEILPLLGVQEPAADARKQSWWQRKYFLKIVNFSRRSTSSWATTEIACGEEGIAERKQILILF